MPSLTFVLPHWMYWSGLLLFPLFAMFVVRREKQRTDKGSTSLATAYLLLIIAGFAGLHRFYVRSLWGLVFIPLFLGILWGNVHTRDARNEASAAENQVMIAKFELQRAQERNEEQVPEKRQALEQAQQSVSTAQETSLFWHRVPRYIALVLLLLLVVDAVLLPGLVRRCRSREPERPPEPSPPDWTDSQAEMDRDPSKTVHSWLTDPIDKLSGFTGHFVALWSILAVFAYYYEVIARYVFNSPTNWVHESMFLMFGMQYLIAGAYALREGSHVRVDVIYMYFPERVKALVDVITSVFFFIFTVTLLWTGWTFAMDSMSVQEVSFTEWAIQYWPVKLAMPIGAALIVLQGIAHLIKDIMVVAGKGVRRGS